MSKKKKTVIALIVAVPVIAFTIALIVISLRSSLTNTEVGDIITFGTNEECREWLVLDKTEDSLLIVSTTTFGKTSYHSELAATTWENSYLRKWLNGEFLQEAFSIKEREIIEFTDVTNEPNPEYGTDGGNNTQDRIFLLSVEEAKKYYPEASDLKTKSFEGQVSWWWLRTTGYSSDRAAVVTPEGTINTYGNTVDNTGGAIRPAMWIRYKTVR